MKYLSLFSGIEAASVAWEPLGWEAVAFAEIEPFPSAVLAERYPDVPNLGDVTGVTREQLRALGHIDAVVGGSPCQGLSIAGKRMGLMDERSGLFIELIRIFEIAREECGARYLLWENVPGALSSGKGQDFAVVLEFMVGRRFDVPNKGWKNAGIAVGPGGDRLVEWRVLDAQYFGVPQRRRRIFALLDTGEWWSRQPVLFEPEGVRRDTQEGRGEGKGTAAGAEEGAGAEGDAGVAIYENHAQDSRVTESIGVCPTLHSQMGTGGGNVPFVLAFDMQAFGQYGNGMKASTVKQRDYKDATDLVLHRTSPDISVVRRLTPTECERLQGFPDGWTDIPWNGKDHAPDSHRYKACGNSMAVPVMRWIGKRMLEAKQVVCDEDAIDRILYVTPSDDGQLSLF